jgi:S-DNA-T family DNA segregation ATPase FtsK/SpoIIIE
LAGDAGRSEHRTLDVVVDVGPAHTVAELTAALCAPFGIDPDVVAITSMRARRRLRPDRVVGEIGLVSGDELEIGPSSVGGPGREGDRPAGPAWGVAVDVVAGPDSGRSVLLGPGRYALGRRAEADVRIHDPSVSRDHAVVTVHGRDGAPGDWVAVIDPARGTANGVTVNDIAVQRPTTLAATDVVTLGATRLAFRPVRVESDEPGLGRIDFHRTPYRPPKVVIGATDAIGPIPTRPEPRRLQILAVLAPLAAGLLMYTFTRQVQFLALTLISPVVMVASVIEDRRTGRRRFRRDLADFRCALPAHCARLDALRHAERIDRFRAAPDVAELVRRAELRTIDLWARGRAAPDFLALRVGLGPATVRFAIELEHGGDDDLRAEALAAVEGVDRLASVPVVVDLCDDRVVGVQGHDDLVDGVAASLLIQAATLHSPEDLIIAGAVAPERPLGWMKWLPHLRSVTSPLPGNHLATTRADADALIARLIEVASFRTATASDRDTSRSWPRLLIVLDHGLDPDPAEVSRLLDAAPDAGISVIWLASTPAGIPRHATRVLDVRLGAGAALVGWLWSTDPDIAGCDLEVEHVRGAIADRAARALAPVRDGSTASLATSIPRMAPLFDVLDVGHPTAVWVTEQWHHSGGYHLRFPIGIGVDGPLALDLVHDGPHTLIGGTSGAGKSELLQSMVAALAAHHPPTRLNFLFVDYKGGASAQVFERLPHTVGYVTNLGASLSLRALTSLRAELNRRMALMEGHAKDLAEMLDRFPAEAPASLVIVVDEFATLVKEVPEFVAGIIDIAQRGRSLGIHLVLATQRPSGSVNENILANTNLRISLRMLDRTESTSVIGSPEAADIPVPLRGRALARLGPRRLVEFQSAFAGAPLTGTDTRQPVLVVPFVHTDDSPRTVSGPSADRDGATQLDVLIDAVAAAAVELDLPPPRRPWCDVLPDVVVLDRLAGRSGHCDRVGDDGVDREVATDPARFVTIGLLDAPERQEQRSALVDLEDGGGLLVFGAGGSGKTTLLRTMAASINANADEASSAMLVFDFASRGLTGLRALPDVIDVATGDDLEAVTRHLAMLDAELRRRRRLLADAGAEHLTAFRREHGGSLARIVVLIDGFGGMVSTLMESSAGGLGGGAADEWVDRVQRLVVEGRQVGIHTVITADRRNAVPSRIHAAVSNRLILRHADEGSYAEHGIGSDRARHLDLVPGRGLLDGATLVQVASVSNDPSARAQVHAIELLAERIDRRPTSTLRSLPLPDRIGLTPGSAAPEPLRAPIGPADVTGEVADVDLAWSNLAVCGPPRSGRSTALATVIDGLRKHHDVAVVGLSTSPLATLDLPAATFGRPSELAPTLDVLANRIATNDAPRSPVLVVDDADVLDDPVLAPLWDRLTGFDHLRLVIALETRAMAGYTTSALVTAARRARRLLVLQPDDPGEFLQTTGLRLPTRPGLRYPPGRGVLLVDRTPHLIQVGVTEGRRRRR